MAKNVPTKRGDFSKRRKEKPEIAVNTRNASGSRQFKYKR